MKVKEFQKSLVDKGIDAALLFWKDPNFLYFVQQKSENAFLLIPKNKKPILFASPLEDVKTMFSKLVYEDPIEDLKHIISRLNIKTIGINESNITVKQKKRIAKMAKTRAVDDILDALRLTKTKEEVKKIRHAIKLTEGIIKRIVKDFHFKKEGEIKRFIKSEAVNLDCTTSFEPIVASGKNAAVPHYFGDSKIKKGFLILDFGLRYEGYCADITRTLYIGTPSNDEMRFYNKLLRIQEQVIRKVKAGVKVKVLEEFVRSEMGSDEKYFTHSLGHGLGIKIHEAPGISSKSLEVLKEGMVITIEPGHYKGFGIRIEDDVLVTKNGHRILTKYPKTLTIIPKV